MIKQTKYCKGLIKLFDSVHKKNYNLNKFEKSYTEKLLLGLNRNELSVFADSSFKTFPKREAYFKKWLKRYAEVSTFVVIDNLGPHDVETMLITKLKLYYELRG